MVFLSSRSWSMRLHEEEAEGGIGIGLIGFHWEESQSETGIGTGLIGFHREESRAETGIGMGLIGFHRENDRIFNSQQRIAKLSK